MKRAILENAKQLRLGGDSKNRTNLLCAKVAPLKRAIVITSQGHELLQVIKENGGNRNMIFTVTLKIHPDTIVRVDQVKVLVVNIVCSDDKSAGGKGINVTEVLKRLNIPNIQRRDISVFKRKFLSDTLAQREIERHVLSRWQKILVSMLKSADQETEINGTRVQLLKVFS